MANTFNFGGGDPAAASTDPAAAAAPSRRPIAPTETRHAFGLPAGSIRALIAFTILGLVWALMAMEREIPLYLQYLMFLILGHYFAAHHRTIKPVDEREWSPLFMPRGMIRMLIFLGFAGALGAMYFFHHRDAPAEFVEELKMKDERTQNLYMPFVLVLGFFIGLVVARFGRLIGGKGGQPGWYQDIQAWFALMALLALVVVVVIELIINPAREAEAKPLITLPAHLNQAMAAFVGFYFGARS
jgi:hypothetical protein